MHGNFKGVNPFINPFIPLGYAPGVYLKHWKGNRNHPFLKFKSQGVHAWISHEREFISFSVGYF